MYHDVLDVLSATQPRLGVQYIRTPRDAFRPIASTIWHARRLIRDYRIPRQNFKALVQLMLSMHLSDSSKNGTESTNGQSESDAAENVVRAFIEQDGHDIAWPTFYTTLLTATVSDVTIGRIKQKANLILALTSLPFLPSPQVLPKTNPYRLARYLQPLFSKPCPHHTCA